MTEQEFKTSKWAIRLPKTIDEAKSFINRYKKLRKMNTYVLGEPVRNSISTSILRTIRKYDYERALLDKAILSNSILKLEDYLNKF